MRDRKTLSLEQFHMQLSKRILSSHFIKTMRREEENFSHKCCLWRSDTEHPNSYFDVILPKNYRETRALAISLWYLPENLKFQVLLKLEERNFAHFNQKQMIEIHLLLESQEICEKYLYLTERYTDSEIFGNLLGNDLRDLEKSLKFIFVRQQRARKKVFRRGPKDKGTRRSVSSTIQIRIEEELKDVFVQQQNDLYDHKVILRHKVIKLILQKIGENFSKEE